MGHVTSNRENLEKETSRSLVGTVGSTFLIKIQKRRVKVLKMNLLELVMCNFFPLFLSIAVL